MFQKTLLVWFVAAASSVNAFVVPVVQPRPIRCTTAMSSNTGGAPGEQHPDEEMVPQEFAEQEFADDQHVAPEEEQPEQEEDPELTALKEEIAATEELLKEKRRQLAYVKDEADEYTKTGYARKVAEMENMRRARSVSDFV